MGADSGSFVKPDPTALFRRRKNRALRRLAQAERSGVAALVWVAVVALVRLEVRWGSRN